MKRLVLGITGGIATGKSSVLSMLAQAGIATLSSDALAHDCIRPGRPAYKAVLRAFGPEVLGRNREIDRKRLGEIVFASPGARRQLERIIHPCVIKALRAFVRRRRGIVALDIPLLFEAGLQSLVDQVIVVYASKNQQIRRLRRRDRLSRPQALARIAAQLPLLGKCRRADVVIDNSHSVAYLRKQMAAFKKHLTLVFPGV